MCQLQPQDAVATKYNNAANNHSSKKPLLDKIWPLPTLVVLALIPLLPTSFYLNRGYTVWFHLMSIGYFFTRSPFIRKILILQGTGICLGWYAAIITDWVVEGTFCHTLYRNMPGSMLPYMVLEEQQLTADDGDIGEFGYVILNTYSSWAMKAFSHVLDTIGHPGLAYLFYKLHLKAGGRIGDVLTWPVIVSAWHISRIWSMVHSYYNTGVPAWWYYGHDVYVLNNLNAYLIAYVAEGVCFGVAILCRLYWDQSSAASSLLSSLPLPMKSEEKRGEKTPALVHSESAVSTSSMI